MEDKPKPKKTISFKDYLIISSHMFGMIIVCAIMYSTIYFALQYSMVLTIFVTWLCSFFILKLIYYIS